jgi:hypothetical protein
LFYLTHFPQTAASAPRGADPGAAGLVHLCLICV